VHPALPPLTTSPKPGLFALHLQQQTFLRLGVSQQFRPTARYVQLPHHRNALLQQPNFSEVSRGESVVDDYDKCLHWSAQPPPPQRLMPELPEEALASLQVSHCMVPSILRRILQH
jgi:hypothetical protein